MTASCSYTTSPSASNVGDVLGSTKWYPIDSDANGKWSQEEGELALSLLIAENRRVIDVMGQGRRAWRANACLYWRAILGRKQAEPRGSTTRIRDSTACIH